MLATQNPIELEGTYPLPEAQLDRFLFNTVLDYLSADDEVKVVDLTTTTLIVQVRACDKRRRKFSTFSSWSAWCQSQIRSLATS